MTHISERDRELAAKCLSAYRGVPVEWVLERMRRPENERDPLAEAVTVAIAEARREGKDAVLSLLAAQNKILEESLDLLMSDSISVDEFEAIEDSLKVKRAEVGT